MFKDKNFVPYYYKIYRNIQKSMYTVHVSLSQGYKRDFTVKYIFQRQAIFIGTVLQYRKSECLYYNSCLAMTNNLQLA